MACFGEKTSMAMCNAKNVLLIVLEPTVFDSNLAIGRFSRAAIKGAVGC